MREYQATDHAYPGTGNPEAEMNGIRLFLHELNGHSGTGIISRGVSHVLSIIKMWVR